jgi:maltose phosphorylase
LKRNFNFMNPLPCMAPFLHVYIPSCFIRQDGHGLYFLLKNIRLDLDDYNKEVEEGCHITSMAGTWMICGRFGGMRVKRHS